VQNFHSHTLKITSEGKDKALKSDRESVKCQVGLQLHRTSKSYLGGLLSVDGVADYNFKIKKMVQICLSMNNIFMGFQNRTKFLKL